MIPRLSFRPGWEVHAGVLLLGYLLAAIALIFGRPWSRAVLLLVSAVGMMGSIASLATGFGSVPEIYAPSILFDTGVWLLPSMIIFVAALRLPASAALQAKASSGLVAKRVVSSRLDLAYGCFAWIAFVLCVYQVMSLLPLDYSTGVFLVMVVGIPLLFSTLLAGLAAVVLSIIEWREWPLMAMSAACVSMWLTLDGEGEIELAWNVCATAIMVSLCVRWFSFTRRRARQTQEPKEQAP